MARPRNITPSYLLHQKTGRARLVWSDAHGVRHEKLLPGDFNSPESLAEKAKLELEIATSATRNTIEPVKMTVAQVLAAFLDHAERYYVGADGKQTTEVGNVIDAIKPVRELYGELPAIEFGPRALAAVRQHMIGLKWCRTGINRNCDRIKRAFKWAASEELIPASVYEALRTLPGLRRGRSAAKESEPVRPVDDATVDATLPFLDAHLRAMVETHRLTGMRPAEVCGLNFAEIDRSGPVWLYRPAHHKTAHHGRQRVIPIGPRAQAVLVAFLRRQGTPPAGFDHIRVNSPEQSDARRVMADAYQEAGRVKDAELLRDVSRRVEVVAGCVVDPMETIFSPAEARDERYRTMRAVRKSKVQPSQMTRRKTNAQRMPGKAWKPTGYAHAVQRAAERAGVPHWHPNQLRHTFATEVRRAHGLEAAQTLLGHSRADVTQVYAERDLQLAATVAAKIG